MANRRMLTRRLATPLAVAVALVIAAVVSVARSAGAQPVSPLVMYDCATQGSAGLQSAENSVPAGGTLYVAGTCAGGVTVQPSTTLAGDNAGTVLGGPVIYTAPGGTVTIRDLQIRCGTATACVDIRGGWRHTITNVVTVGGTYGIELSAPPCAKGSGCDVNDYLSHDFLRDSSSYGLYVNDAANTITDGYFTDSWVAGGTDSIHLANAAGWNVSDDHVYGQTGLAVYANRLYGSQISGIYGEAGGMTLIVQKNSQPSVIFGNRLRAGTITLTSVGPGCSVTVFGNVTATPIVNSSSCTVAATGNLP